MLRHTTILNSCGRKVFETVLSEDAIKIKYKTIFLASDHAGLEMKNYLIGRFPFLPWKDLGPNSSESVDYPDYAQKLCRAMESEPGTIGVLICGSGQGMAISANRFPFVRAALCWSEDVAKLSRQHNNANVLCLAGRLTPYPVTDKILLSFLETEFEGGRHQRRVEKI